MVVRVSGWRYDQSCGWREVGDKWEGSVPLKLGVVDR